MDVKPLIDLARLMAPTVVAQSSPLSVPPVAPTELERFDVVATHPHLIKASRKLFADGHHTPAVEQAFKALNAYVKTRSGLDDDGVPLMHRAFSPEKPVLALSRLKTRTEKDEQFGVMSMLAGAMAAIRNPRAHDAEERDGVDAALEQITIANYLFKAVDRAERVDGGS